MTISKRTLWLTIAVAVVVIAAAVTYLVMQANKGKEFLEGKTPENISQETKEVINSASLDADLTASQPVGLDQSDFGDLNSGIEQLDKDINKL